MTANPKPSAEALRRAEIKRRRETSAFWMAVHILGSLNLAVILLITIAGAIGFATVMESRFDSDVARYYIYKSTWFDVWLLVLGLNLLRVEGLRLARHIQRVFASTKRRCRDHFDGG